MKIILPYPFVRMACAFSQGETAGLNPSDCGLALRGLGKEWQLSAINGNALIEIRWPSEAGNGGFARGLNVPSTLLKMTSHFVFDTETGLCETRTSSGLDVSVPLYFDGDEYEMASGLALRYTERCLPMLDREEVDTWNAKTFVPLHVWEKLDTKKHGFAKWLGKQDPFGKYCSLTRLTSTEPAGEWPIVARFPHHERDNENSPLNTEFDIVVLFMPHIEIKCNYENDDL